jgi:hypothetical protein
MAPNPDRIGAISLLGGVERPVCPATVTTTVTKCVITRGPTPRISGAGGETWRYRVSQGGRFETDTAAIAGPFTRRSEATCRRPSRESRRPWGTGHPRDLTYLSGLPQVTRDDGGPGTGWTSLNPAHHRRDPHGNGAHARHLDGNPEPRTDTSCTQPPSTLSTVIDRSDSSEYLITSSMLLRIDCPRDTANRVTRADDHPQVAE